MRRLCLILLLVPALAGAETITLKLGGSSGRSVDVVESPTAKLSPSEPRTDSAIKIEASADQWIRVYDPITGNLAARKASDILKTTRSADSNGTWTVFKVDYNRVGELKVRADRGGKRLEMGSISIGDQTQLLSEEHQGTAVFYGVPHGKVKTSASYREGSETRTVTQEFVVPAERDLAVPELIVALPAETEAEPVPADPNKLPPPKGAPAPTGLFGNIVAMLIAAVAALGVLFFGMKWIYGNQDKAKDALTKLGVQVPDPIAPDDPAPPPVADPFPQPITPIVLDPAPAVMGGGLSLVGASGSFELNEGVHVVGREAGLTIALVGESTVSRRHAEIVRTGDSVVVRDVGSTNGTFVNGARLNGDQPLRPGDRVQFGSVGFEVKSL